MSKLTPRAAFIKNATLERLAKHSWGAMTLASRHDPDLLKLIGDLQSRVDVIERQLERIGAPQYRLVRKGKHVNHRGSR